MLRQKFKTNGFNTCDLTSFISFFIISLCNIALWNSVFSDAINPGC